MDDKWVYSKSVRRKVDSLEARKRALELKMRDLDREIEELLTGQSAIGVGDRIVWDAGSRERYGTVLAVMTQWRGFVYRVAVTTKDGRVIGNATVEESHQPRLKE